MHPWKKQGGDCLIPSRQIVEPYFPLVVISHVVVVTFKLILDISMSYHGYTLPDMKALQDLCGDQGDKTVQKIGGACLQLHYHTAYILFWGDE